MRIFISILVLTLILVVLKVTGIMPVHWAQMIAETFFYPIIPTLVLSTFIYRKNDTGQIGVFSESGRYSRAAIILAAQCSLITSGVTLMIPMTALWWHQIMAYGVVIAMFMSNLAWLLEYKLSDDDLKSLGLFRIIRTIAMLVTGSTVIGMESFWYAAFAGFCFFILWMKTILITLTDTSEEKQSEW